MTGSHFSGFALLAAGAHAETDEDSHDLPHVNGEVIAMSYDLAGRPDEVSLPDRTRAFAYTLSGQVREIVEGSDTWRFDYDAHDRLIRAQDSGRELGHPLFPSISLWASRRPNRPFRSDRSSREKPTRPGARGA